MAQVFWFTGLPCSGKTTIGKEVAGKIHGSLHLDGDVVRKGLCQDLGFSIEDRNENLRRIAEVAGLFRGAGHDVVVTFISPTIQSRVNAKEIVGERHFRLVYVRASLEVCEERDVKGMYAKASSGDIQDFTGISSPFEEPDAPDLVFHTEDCLEEVSVQEFMDYFRFVDSKVQHASFIGRWCPFHRGHWEIMRLTYEKNKRPLLVFVRDTGFDAFSSDYRRRMVEASLAEMGVPGTVMVIPDVKSINWGRGVGYETNLVEVEEEVKGISATDIRERILSGDDSWKELVCPGVAEFIEDEGTESFVTLA